MKETKSAPTRLVVARLNPRAEHDFELRPDADTCAALAEHLGATAIRKLRFAGKVQATGGRGWRLDAELGATVVQPCIVTLQPVTTRIDMPVTRRFLPASEIEPAPEPGAEIEMPEDDTLEPLGSEIDLQAVMTEALALAMPAYPRAEGAALGEAVYADPGVAPLRDEDTRPFAGLKDLRDSLRGDDAEGAGNGGHDDDATDDETR
ncbi:YceD family protein [Citreimonas sp.]|uniref:YceD family protein n=1 Tax=Citreimonas sp. TaxID=3036715 RepID=UPI00405A4059